MAKVDLKILKDIKAKSYLDKGSKVKHIIDCSRFNWKDVVETLEELKEFIKQLSHEQHCLMLLGYRDVCKCDASAGQNLLKERFEDEHN